MREGSVTGFLRVCSALATLVAFGACVDTSRPMEEPPVGPDELAAPTGRAVRPSVSAQLHLHGWSNHSGNARPASIAWHTQQYSAAGVDVLWWTDHSDIYLGRVPDFNVTPTVPVAVMPGLWTIGTWGPYARGRAFLRSGTVPSVDSAAGRVDVPLFQGDAPQADTIELFFGELHASKPRRAALGILARPLIGRPRFTMTVWSIGPHRRLPFTQVLVPLAWHPGPGGGSRQVLRYTFANGAAPYAVMRGDTLELRRGWSGEDSGTVALEPAVDVAGFPNGIDNTTDEYRIQFVVERSAPGRTLAFTLPKVANAASTAAVQMTPAVQLAHSMAEAYGVRAMWGLERVVQPGPIAGTKWYAVSGAGMHQALYLPRDVSSSLENSLAEAAAAHAELVRSLGGLTSIAHPFGTSTAPPVGTEGEQLNEARELGSFLVPYGAWQASLIEVGTIRRGRVGLRAHMYLLDYLWASGLRVCGVGVTDAHGGLLLRDPVPGTTDQYNFVTWIGGVDRLADGAQLVGAMRSCDLSFGDPFYTHGGMWIGVESDSLGRHTLSFDTSGVSPSADLFLYEAEVDSTGIGHDPVYRRYGQAVTRSDRLEVGGCRAGFARLEAWAGNRPLAFSNLVALAPDPDRCPQHPLNR